MKSIRSFWLSFFGICCTLSGMDFIPQELFPDSLNKRSEVNERLQGQSHVSAVSREREYVNSCGILNQMVNEQDLPESAMALVNQRIISESYGSGLLRTLNSLFCCGVPEDEDQESHPLLVDRENEYQQPGSFLSLPSEIVTRVLDYLGPTKSLAAFARTCHQAYDLSQSIFAQAPQWQKSKNFYKVESVPFSSKITVVKIGKRGLMVVGTRLGHMKAWMNKKLFLCPFSVGQRINDIAINGGLVFFCSGSNGVGRWDVANNHFDIIDPHKGVQLACALSGDEKILVTGGLNSNELVMRDSVTGKQTRSFFVSQKVASINKIKIDNTGETVLVLYGREFYKESPFQDRYNINARNYPPGFGQQLLMGNLKTGVWRVLQDSVGFECALHDADLYLWQNCELLYEQCEQQCCYQLERSDVSLHVVKDGEQKALINTKKKDLDSPTTFFVLTNDAKGLLVHDASEWGSVFHFYYFEEQSKSFVRFGSWRPNFSLFGPDSSIAMDMSPDGSQVAFSNGCSVEVWQKGS